MELLTLGLTKMREELGADHPYVRRVLEKDSPRQVATRLVQGTKLYDVALRRSLWTGGPEAVAASTDPMIVFVRRLDVGMVRAELLAHLGEPQHQELHLQLAVDGDLLNVTRSVAGSPGRR